MIENKNLRVVIGVITIVLIIGCIGYAILAYRNYAHYETVKIDSEENYDLFPMYDVEFMSLIEHIFDKYTYVKIPINAETDTKINGYKDLSVSSIYVYLDSDVEISYVEANDRVDNLHIICSGEGTHDLLDFSEYYSDLTSLYFTDCNFPDDYKIKVDNIYTFDFENCTNVDYDLVNDSEKLHILSIEDLSEEQVDLPVFKEGLSSIKVRINTPITYDINSLPKSMESIYFYTEYDGPESDYTIYGLENFEELKSANFLNSTKITTSSYEFAEENRIDISTLSDELEIVDSVE